MRESGIKDNCRKFKITVVTAVYNTHLFLREAIESIITQDIGFEDNVQLILVDDGSTDESGRICDQFAELYPENILALHKENGGVSSARNEGLKYVEGEYINFMDSDDKMQSDALRKAYEFLEIHRDEVDIVSIPVKYFDGSDREPLLNDKYANGTRIIDLTEEPTALLMSLSYAFTKSRLFEDLRYDTRLSFGEDAQITWQILLEKRKLGVISDTYYFYRIRTTGEPSAMQTIGRGNAKAFYIPHIKCLLLYTMEHLMKAMGYIPKFIQYENASNIQITLMINQSYEIDCEVNRSKKYGKYSMGVDIFPAYEFKGKIPSSDIDEIMKITVCTYVDGRRVERKNLRGETLFPVNRSFRNVSCEKNGYMASMEGNALLIQKVDE